MTLWNLHIMFKDIMSVIFTLFRYENNLAQFQILRKLSHDPVATAIPSSVTPRQLTLLSWPASTPVKRNIQNR